MVKLAIMGLLLLCTILYLVGGCMTFRALFRDQCDGCDLTSIMIFVLNAAGAVVAGYGLYYVIMYFELG